MNEKIHRGPVSLYLHFPFCERKCRYCDFLSGPACAEEREDYIELLCREIRMRAPEVTAPVDTIFIGGGTPSLMTPEQADRLMQAISSAFHVMDNAEISMEVNPGTADLTKLRAYRLAGINRLSIGVQSFDDAELKLLGRIHTSDQARRIFHMAREAGFSNINLDLMSALPGQNIETWSKTLREAVALRPEHLSAYSLIIEEGTPFAKMFSQKELPALPSEEEDREIYHFTKKFLAENGYRRYEISNYAREGYECRHNCGYWTGHEYLGLGLGASSDLGGMRFKNPDQMSLYRKLIEERNTAALRCEKQEMTKEDRMEEFMYLGLRMTDGVSESEFKERFGTRIEDQYGKVLRRHISQNLIRRLPGHSARPAFPGDSGEPACSGNGGRLALTEYGLDVANYVMADYLL
jgi:oxygen-independent coproporphyrinogen-3 oxidase